MQETWVWSLGQEDPLEEGMATDFVVTALLKFAILSTSYTTGWTHSKSLPVGEKWIYILQILAFKITVICVVLFCSKQNKHGARSKEPACQFRRYERHRFNPWVRKIPWRRKWQPTPVFMPEESHGQRSLAGYSLGLQRWALTNLSPVSLRKSVKVKVKSLSRVQLFGTPWTVAHQTPLSIGFSRQEFRSGLPFLSPGDLPNPGIEPRSLTLQADSLLSEPPDPAPQNDYILSLSLTRFWFRRKAYLLNSPLALFFFWRIPFLLSLENTEQLRIVANGHVSSQPLIKRGWKRLHSKIVFSVTELFSVLFLRVSKMLQDFQKFLFSCKTL